MKYYKQNGSEFIENGQSKIRVETVRLQPSPKTQGRIVKIVNVSEVLAINPLNPIAVGNVLAVSFPEPSVNAPQYQWHPGEEFCVPMQVAVTAQTIAQDNNIDPALL